MEESVKTVSGTVIFLKNSAGSKSEHIQPYIYVDMNKIIRVRHKDDNPFENGTLSEYDGKMVVAEGWQIDTGTFLIEKIYCENRSTKEENDGCLF